MADPKLPTGSARCKCAGCGRYFTSVSGFDMHQRLRKDGTVECRDPGALRVKKTGEPLMMFNDAGYWQYQEMPREAIEARTKRVERAEGAEKVSEVVSRVQGQFWPNAEVLQADRRTA